MDIQHEEHKGVIVLTPQFPHLDALTSPGFNKQMLGLVKPGARVLMDLEKVTWADSSGCGVIIALVKHLRSEGGDLKLCGLTRPVRTLFQLVRLHKICDVFNTRQEGLAAYELAPSSSSTTPST